MSGSRFFTGKNAMNTNNCWDRDEILLLVRYLNLEAEGFERTEGVDLSIKRARVYLVTGPDDEANVLLLRILGGLLPPPSPGPILPGRVLFQGTDLYEGSDHEIEQAKKKIAFVFREGTMISNLTIKENLLLPCQYHYPERACTVTMAKIAGDFRFFDIPDVLDKRPNLVSYGVKKKLAFIRASLQEPELMLVEKPMFNLEAEDREQVFHYLADLKKKGVAFIIVSHFQSLLETLIDEAIVLEEGKAPMMIDKIDTAFAALSRFAAVRS
jgi:ABC-type lipoprotein export system ATPase subunit